MTASSANSHGREWDAGAYHRLGRPQLGWGRSLLETVPLAGRETVLDAGCGSGGLTAELATRVPTGLVIAMDQSVNMLRVARENLDPGLRARVGFVQADLTAIPLSEAVDGIFSAATFHWIVDHPRLFEQLYGALRPGGWLVAQCGGGPNVARLLQRATQLMARDPYRPHFVGWSDPWLFTDAERAASTMMNVGFVDVQASLVEAPTVLNGREEFVSFVEAVVVRVHLQQLPSESLRRAFLAELADRAAGDNPPFLLDYWRLNLRARRPTEPSRAG